MAMRELPLRTAKAFGNTTRPAIRLAAPLCRRNASSEAVREVEAGSSFEVPPPSEEVVRDYDPVARSRLRRRGNKQLPPSRYAHAIAPQATSRSQPVDTNTAPPSTTAALCIPTSLRRSRTPHHDSSSPGRSVSPVSSKRTRARSPLTSSPSHTSTTPQATEPQRRNRDYENGQATHRTTRIVP